MAKAIGMDLGTTNSVAAVWEGDKGTVIGVILDLLERIDFLETRIRDLENSFQ